MVTCENVGEPTMKVTVEGEFAPFGSRPSIRMRAHNARNFVSLSFKLDVDLKSYIEGHSEKMGVFLRSWQSGR